MRNASTHLVQLWHPDEGRRVALVCDNELHLLATYRTVYSFALTALDTGWKLRDLLSTDLSGIVLEYAHVHGLQTNWRFLPAFDDEQQPGRCQVSAVAPGGAWKCLGSSDRLRAHGDPLMLTEAREAIQIPELAAVYVAGREGPPRRVGVAQGVGMAIGPELILDSEMTRLEGNAIVFRDGRQLAAPPLSGGDLPLGLALASVEPDHFQRAGRRRPGDSQVHFFGAKLFADLSFPALREGDEIAVELTGFGRPLRTAVTVAEADACVAVPL